MLSSHRSWLAFLRLLLAFIALCLLLAQLEIAQRLLHNQTTGMPGPILRQAPLPARSGHPFLGISLDPAQLTAVYSASEQNGLLAELTTAGFGWARVRVAWDQVEPSPRNFEWQRVDQILESLSAAGIMPILLLDGSPAWARAPNDRNSAQGALAPPANPASFARFARAVASRYSDQVLYYQIWDEPNIAPHWGARHIEAVNYARMLKAASTAIHSVDPGAAILLAALAPTRDRGHLAQDERYFLNRLYAAGAAPFFDGVAIQPFGFATHPDDIEVNRSALNFRRALWIRQTMVEAGDGDTPIWIMRFGWNRIPASPWQSVSAEEQRCFTRDALQMAYQQWPWVAGMGWPTLIPAPDNADAGFALTPELLDTFQEATNTFLAARRPRNAPTPPLALWMPTALWLLAIAALLWRAVAAARRLPWQTIRAFWVARPAWQQGISWAILLLLYYLAVWPPLLLLIAMLAALGFLAQPRLGLALALFVLPFYDFHKEFDWLGRHWQIPPTQAVLLCLLPSIWRYRPRRLVHDRWQAMALAWLLLSLLGALNVWYWPAYTSGMINLVITPLSLYLLIRVWATNRNHTQALIFALAAGGVLIAVIGLLDWLQGRGTSADGMRRLTGLGFSSNHTALYLIRTLAITAGLTLAANVRTKWLWAISLLITAIALLLTASRGAILLGLPAAALYIFSRRNLPLPSRRRMTGMALVVLVGMAVLGWMWRDRFTNFGTMIARMDGWIVALNLWFDYFLLGVGPDGFWWTFPAKMWLNSTADPNLRHPHNLWLEFATSGGLLAIAWLIAITILLYRWARPKQDRLTWLQVGLLTGLIASFAHAQVDAFQALSELAGWNWAALALLIASGHETDSKAQVAHSDA